VVFDKTGTITHGKLPEVSWVGEIAEHELAIVKLLTGSSAHPLSVLIHHHLKRQSLNSITDFKEIPGKGIEARVDGKLYKIGSAAFVGFLEKIDLQSSRVFVSVDHEIKGYFSIRVTLRKNLKDMLQRLGSKCKALLSGDNNGDEGSMKKVFAPTVQLLFNQSPHDKLDFIRDLQNSGQKVLMMGDGLNDSGAFKQSDVGLAVTDNTGVFTPACDGILQGEKLNDLDKFLSLAKSSSTILKTGFAISFLYNAVALSFAVTGNLTPLVAAILMPVSSISVVGFSTLAVNYVARQKLKS